MHVEVVAYSCAWLERRYGLRRANGRTELRRGLPALHEWIEGKAARAFTAPGLFAGSEPDPDTSVLVSSCVWALQ